MTKKERIARFRERARTIVKDDRFKRKHGLSVDTGGAITRALEKAFQDGLKTAQSDKIQESNTEAREITSISWITIPPRPRGAFWRICLSLLGTNLEERKEKGCLQTAWSKNEVKSWAVSTQHSNADDAISDRSIQPLLSLALLEYIGEREVSIQLTQLGVATWERFCKLGGTFPDDDIFW